MFIPIAWDDQRRAWIIMRIPPWGFGKPPLWMWEDDITWKPRKVSFFCGACCQHRTTTCDINCVEEVGHGARAKYEIIGPEPEKRRAYEAAHKCAS